MGLLNNMLYSGILFSVIALISGSVPYGVLYSAIRGVDIRIVGSGNIGATNVMRQFGFWQGFVPVFILDVAKGVIPVMLFKILISSDNNPELYDIFEIIIGICAILGHIFSPFLGFKGGKGVATTTGVLLAWNYQATLICLLIFIIVFLTFGKKIIGRASIVVSCCFPIVVFFVPDTSMIFKIVSLFLGVLILFAHKKNILEWKTGEDLEKKIKSQQQKEKK